MVYTGRRKSIPFSNIVYKELSKHLTEKGCVFFFTCIELHFCVWWIKWSQLCRLDVSSSSVAILHT